MVRVFELVLCDGVPHCDKSNSPNDCDTCVLWHVGILTPLLDDKRCLASSLSFPTVPLLASMSLMTCFVGSRRHLRYIRNIFSCLLITSCSFGMLSAAVVPKTDCSSTHVLCLCGGLGSSLLLCLLSCSGFSLSNLLRGLSQLRLLCFFDSTASFTAIVLASSPGWNC